MIKSTERFIFSEPIPNVTRLGSIRLSVYDSVFSVNRTNNQFLYASVVLNSSSSSSSSNTNTNTKTNNISSSSSNTSSNITTVPNYNSNGTPILYSTIIPGAYDLFEIAENIKEIEPDKNSMKYRIEIKARIT